MVPPPYTVKLLPEENKTTRKEVGTITSEAKRLTLNAISGKVNFKAPAYHRPMQYGRSPEPTRTTPIGMEIFKALHNSEITVLPQPMRDPQKTSCKPYHLPKQYERSAKVNPAEEILPKLSKCMTVLPTTLPRTSAVQNKGAVDEEDIVQTPLKIVQNVQSYQQYNVCINKNLSESVQDISESYFYCTQIPKTSPPMEINYASIITPDVKSYKGEKITYPLKPFSDSSCDSEINCVPVYFGGSVHNTNDSGSPVMCPSQSTQLIAEKSACNNKACLLMTTPHDGEVKHKTLKIVRQFARKLSPMRSSTNNPSTSEVFKGGFKMNPKLLFLLFGEKTRKSNNEENFIPRSVYSEELNADKKSGNLETPKDEDKCGKDCDEATHFDDRVSDFLQILETREKKDADRESHNSTPEPNSSLIRFEKDDLSQASEETDGNVKNDNYTLLPRPTAIKLEQNKTLPKSPTPNKPFRLDYDKVISREMTCRNESKVLFRFDDLPTAYSEQKYLYMDQYTYKISNILDKIILDTITLGYAMK